MKCAITSRPDRRPVHGFHRRSYNRYIIYLPNNNNNRRRRRRWRRQTTRSFILYGRTYLTDRLVIEKQTYYSSCSYGSFGGPSEIRLFSSCIRIYPPIITLPDTYYMGTPSFVFTIIVIYVYYIIIYYITRSRIIYICTY